MTTPKPFESFSTYGSFKHQVDSLDHLNSKFIDISANLAKYQEKKTELNEYGDFRGDYLEYRDKINTVQGAAKEDIEQMIIQQNNVYIIGMITVTTILISLYLVLRK